ncbi:MAG: Glu-tRNA(Gln) amidotransferase subunit GatE [Nitrososphaerales archaeon]
MTKIEHDSKSIQLKVGLEVHQQLATKTKLFCACPPYFEKENETLPEAGQKTCVLKRVLRPATSELGELDIAAKFESRKEIRVQYLVDEDTSCLVEADEEPPHPISKEATETALVFALALNSRIADEIHVMRKIVVDGSNTSGFQRTAVISLGGKLRFNDGNSSVDVQSISLEEDAARAVKKDSESDARTYALDRLGTPLVEVALAPIEGTQEEVEDAAKTLGRLMRSTGRVARGLGTIRQDLNISVMNGNVIEVKGVQRLDQISKVVIFESSRQKFFFDLAEEIREKIGPKLLISSRDVTTYFNATKSQVMKKALAEQNSRVYCIVVNGFSGYFGRENQYHSRLGKELGVVAKTFGLGGVFHSDELPNYGITQSEITILSENLGISQRDGFVLIAGTKAKVTRASDALILRIENITTGVPAETRAASLDGETTFLRPRPGSARMYPETDIPLIQVSKESLVPLKELVPEPWKVQVEKFAKNYELPMQLAEPLFDSEYRTLFESIISRSSLPPRYVASVFVDTFQSILRDGVDVHSLGFDAIMEVFGALNAGKFAKEATSPLLKTLAENKTLSVDEALLQLGFVAISNDELKKIVEQTIMENEPLLKKGKEAARGALMGRVMQKVRGRADGKLVNEMVETCLEIYEKGKD